MEPGWVREGEGAVRVPLQTENSPLKIKNGVKKREGVGEIRVGGMFWAELIYATIREFSKKNDYELFTLFCILSRGNKKWRKKSSIKIEGVLRVMS